MISQNKDNISKINLKFWKDSSLVDIIAYPLSLLDFMTTTYGIFTQALNVQGAIGIIESILLAGIILYVVFISKDKVAPALEKKIATPLRSLSSKVEQSQYIEFIADAIAPVTVLLISIAFVIIDFWTSLAGIGAIIQFKGVLGLVLQSFAVFALVFSSWYLLYLKPRQVN